MRFTLRTQVRLLLSFLVLLSVALGLLVSVRTVTHAASLHLWLSQKVAPPTAGIRLSGRGFGQNESVTIAFDLSQMGTITTDTTGSFTTAINVPRTALPGNHTVQATGQTSGLTASTLVLVQTDWAQFRFGAYRTGSNPYENVLNPSNVSGLTLDWSYNTKAPIVSSPTVVNGVVYVGSHNYKLYAFDEATGALKWSFTTAHWIRSTPAVVNNVVYVCSDDSNLYALDATTGALKWSYFDQTHPQNFTSPAVANGVVYVVSGNKAGGSINALDAATGTLKWSAGIAPWVIHNSLVVANGIVYAASSNGQWAAFNATTGAVIWNDTWGMGPVSTPAVVNGLLYFILPSNVDNLQAYDAATGTEKWSVGLNGYTSFSSPTVANGIVYTSTGDIEARDAVTGILKWSTIVGGASTYSSPAVANGVVYVGSDDGKLYALDAKTGTLLWNFATGKSIRSSPTVVNGVVYVGSDDGKLYAFHLPGMIP